MSTIDALDWERFVTAAVEDVFDTMLSMEVIRIPAGNALSPGKPLIVGSVSVAGSVLGNVSIHLNHLFATKITAAMLGISVGDVEDEGQVHDVIGEVCNIVGGNLKSRLCDSGFPCELSIPTITAGSDFQIKSRGWELNARFGFQNHEHTALVEIFMKCVPK